MEPTTRLALTDEQVHVLLLAIEHASEVGAFDVAEDIEAECLYNRLNAARARLAATIRPGTR